LVFSFLLSAICIFLSFSFPSTFYSLPSTFYSLPSAFYSLPSALYPLLSAIYSLPSTFYSLPSACLLLSILTASDDGRAGETATISHCPSGEREGTLGQAEWIGL
jgi:hypothetical protein